MGPIDYVVLEWPGEQPSGEAAPLIVDLVEGGTIRILDLAFLGKDENGSVGHDRRAGRDRAGRLTGSVSRFATAVLAVGIDPVGRARTPAACGRRTLARHAPGAGRFVVRWIRRSRGTSRTPPTSAAATGSTSR
jgi:hypothetical protein